MGHLHLPRSLRRLLHADEDLQPFLDGASGEADPEPVLLEM